ncbi:MAG TPA: hypothetical protein VFG35_12695 [Actinoplanes sp.]|nr:hypothetical protein [Actinoplanes sp.]
MILAHTEVPSTPAISVVGFPLHEDLLATVPLTADHLFTNATWKHPLNAFQIAFEG